MAPTWEDCSHLTEVILNIVEDTGFKINLAKAQKVQKTMKHLGMDNGRSPDLQCIDLINKLPTPICVCILRSFLGLTGFL